jgi:hypothetical protein
MAWTSTRKWQTKTPTHIAWGKLLEGHKWLLWHTGDKCKIPNRSFRDLIWVLQIGDILDWSFRLWQWIFVRSWLTLRYFVIGTLYCVLDYYQLCAVSYAITNVMCHRWLPMSCFVLCNYQCFRKTYCLYFTLRMEAVFSPETLWTVS